MQFYDILRSIITNAMLAALLFSLAKPKCRPRTLVTALIAIVVSDVMLNIYFYLQNDYTTLGKLDILFFILISFAVKPLFLETFMQWLFSCFTAMNVYAVTVILSYYLCGLFPYPAYAVIVLRIMLFSAAIWLFRKRLRPLYQQAAEQWSLYLFVAAGLFINFAWYFVASDDVRQMLSTDYAPLLLLVMLTILIYIAMLFSLRKTLREAALKEENLKMLSDRELTRQRLSLMEEAVKQMSIVQHDRRHFNNTLLELLKEGETQKAAGLIQRQSEALPQKPQSYCQNVSVNAAVSYYANLANRQGIGCQFRLDIPEKLHVDELSLAMALSNLMENAIKALSTLSYQREPVLRFTAVYTGQLIIEMSNPTDDEVLLDENGLPRSAKEGHGKGTQSVADFVNKCGGELTYELKDGLFKVRMMV